MSLIIASNKPNENSVGGVDDSIFKPYSFRNDMSSTISLPKNAQIALQSAKVNIDSSIILDEGNKFFYFYFGQGVRPPTSTFNTLRDMDDSSAYPIKILFNSENNGKVAANTLDFAEKLEEALNLYVAHPQLTNRITVSQKFGVTGNFEGYDIIYGAGLTPQNSGAAAYTPTRYVPPDGTAVATLQYNQRYGADGLPRLLGQAGIIAPALWTYAAGVFEITALRARTQITTFNVPPIVNIAGECKYNVTNAIGRDATETAKFFVGLSRSSVHNSRRTRINPTYYIPTSSRQNVRWLQSYVDICCWVDNQTVPGGGGYRVDGQLNLSNCVVNSLLTGANAYTESHKFHPKFSTYAYWTLGAGQTDFAAPVSVYANLPDGTAFQDIVFRVNGESLSVHLISAGATEYKLYSNLDTNIAANNLKPLTQDCWSLFPIMGLNNDILIGAEQTKSIEITNYTGANSNYATLMTNGKSGARNGDIGWVNGVNRNGADEFALVNGGGWVFPDAPGGYMAWEQRCLAENEAWRVIELMSRDFINRGSFIYTDIGAPRNGLNLVKYGTVSGAVPNTAYDLQKPVLILAQSDSYSPTQGAGMGELLGFSGQPIVNSVVDNIVNFKMSSISVPLYVSTKSMFVRINNLTQTSTNMRAGQISKIVGHLPRFVQDRVNSSGPLYLEPTNLIYLDLNNPEELRINSLDISICYVDEKEADSLIGTTILCFHVKQK